MGLFDGLFENNQTKKTHVTPGGFSGEGYGLQNGGYTYDQNYTPTINDITANPQSYANFDFSKMDAGSLGTEPNGGLANMFNSGTLDLGLKGLGALGNVWQARTAAQGLDLAKDKFNWEKGLAAANYGNQAKSYNEELARKADVGLALGGNAVSPEQRASTLANVEANKISPTLKV